MSRRGSRAEIFAVQSDCEEESAIETVLTDAEEDWTAVTPEPRRPRAQSRRQKSVLRERHKRRTRDDVPWDHHEKHRHTRAPIGISEKIERRLAEKEKMNAKRGGGRSRSASRKPAVIYDEDDDESFLSSYANGADEETAVTSISQLKRELKRMAKLKSSSEKKSKTKSKKKSKSKDEKRTKKSKKSGKRRRKKRGDGDAFEQLFKACDTSGGVYGAACKMVDKAFQLDSSSDEESSSDDDSSDEEDTTIGASTAVSTAVTAADNTAITGFTEATSAVPSFDTTKHSGTTATGYTGATGYTEETPAPPSRRTPRRKAAVSSKRSPPATTPSSSRGKPMPQPLTPHKKSGAHRYRQVIAPPGKLGLSLTSSPQGPMVKMVSRHCPVNVKVGDVIARVNGQSVLGMDCKRVMEMFVTLAKREKIIDILPQGVGGGGAPSGAIGKPRTSAATPSRRGTASSGQHRHSPQTMRSKSTPRAAGPSRSRSRSQRRH